MSNFAPEMIKSFRLLFSDGAEYFAFLLAVLSPEMDFFSHGLNLYGKFKKITTASTDRDQEIERDKNIFSPTETNIAYNEPYNEDLCGSH